MDIKTFLAENPEVTFNQWSFWAKRTNVSSNPMHLEDPYCCDVPKLGNNYAGVAFHENRPVCEKCLENFKRIKRTRKELEHDR